MTFSPRWQIVAASCACAAASSYIFAVSPASGHYPQCLLYRTTGLYCAGCGTTRAIHALLHGRVLDALHDNLLFVSLLPMAALLGGSYALRAWTQNRWPAVMLTERVLLSRGAAALAVMLSFTVLRNLPWPALEFLRPLAA